MEIEESEGAYRRHGAAVLGYARRCVGRPDVAEEIASQDFLGLFRNLERIDAMGLPSWLYAVVKNRAIDYWRRHKLETEFAERQRDVFQPAEFSADWGLLENRDLNAAHRTCLTLRCIPGVSREEIAAFTGLWETQVKGCLRYGLELLRKTLAECRVEEQG